MRHAVTIMKCDINENETHLNGQSAYTAVDTHTHSTVQLTAIMETNIHNSHIELQRERESWV
jgi:hypothetical protein